MPRSVTPTGGEVPPPNTKTKAQSSHNIYVGLIGELAGVAVLAILADMNDDLGKLLVALMAGWFLIFLMINASWLSTVTKKV